MATRRTARRLRNRRRREVISAMGLAVLFILGAGVLLYPSAASWVTQAQQSAIIDAYAQEVTNESPAALEAAIDAAHDYNRHLRDGATVAAGMNVPTFRGERADDGYAEQLDANGTGLMARVKIPAIGVDLPIYHGTSDRVLRRGIGHLEGTALPVGGESTHAVLTGHRGLADAELFSHLDQVRPGDDFTIEVFGEVLSYRVKTVRVVDPEDTQTLNPVAGEDLVTLVTCTPLGINTQRILVTGERIMPTLPEAEAEAGKTPEVPGFPWWGVGLGAAIALAASYVIVVLRRSRRDRAAAEVRDDCEHPGDSGRALEVP